MIGFTKENVYFLKIVISFLTGREQSSEGGEVPPKGGGADISRVTDREKSWQGEAGRAAGESPSTWPKVT